MAQEGSIWMGGVLQHKSARERSKGKALEEVDWIRRTKKKRTKNRGGSKSRKRKVRGLPLGRVVDPCRKLVVEGWRAFQGEGKKKRHRETAEKILGTVLQEKETNRRHSGGQRSRRPKLGKKKKKRGFWFGLGVRQTDRQPDRQGPVNEVHQPSLKFWGRCRDGGRIKKNPGKGVRKIRSKMIYNQTEAKKKKGRGV